LMMSRWRSKTSKNSQRQHDTSRERPIIPDTPRGY
jgi:hypothetical protein